MHRLMSLAIVMIAMVGSFLMVAPRVNAEVYPFTAKYTVYYHDVKFGQSERTLRKLKNSDYKLTSQASVLLGSGSYENNSWFKLHAGQVTAQRYKHKSSVVGFTTVSSAFFDDRGSVVMNYDDQQVKLAISPHVVDMGALTILIQNDLKLGKQAFDYEWVFEGEVEAVEFQYIGKEKIDTIFGQMHAIKLKQVTKKKRISYLWFVPKLDYQLAKIEVYKRGKRWGSLQLIDLAFR